MATVPSKWSSSRITFDVMSWLDEFPTHRALIFALCLGRGKRADHERISRLARARAAAGST